MDRRRFLALGGGSLSALFLGGCDSAGPSRLRPLLRWAERNNEQVERWIFHEGSRSAPASDMLAGRALPSYFISPSVPVWSEARDGVWSLEITGAVERPTRLTLAQLMRLPARTQRVNHYCVEGWTARTQWTGVRVSDLARLVGLKPDAAYVDFQSFDQGYHESWDLDSALHPQTVIAYGREGKPLPPAYGAPARVHSPVKLGYKNTKYLTRVIFMPERNGGYWSDRGYEWYGGV